MGTKSFVLLNRSCAVAAAAALFRLARPTSTDCEKLHFALRCCAGKVACQAPAREVSCAFLSPLCVSSVLSLWRVVPREITGSRARPGPRVRSELKAPSGPRARPVRLDRQDLPVRKGRRARRAPRETLERWVRPAPTVRRASLARVFRVRRATLDRPGLSGHLDPLGLSRPTVGRASLAAGPGIPGPMRADVLDRPGLSGHLDPLGSCRPPRMPVLERSVRLARRGRVGPCRSCWTSGSGWSFWNGLGPAGEAAPKMTFTLRSIPSDAGKPASGACSQGEQLIAATCSTGAMIGDDGSASCPAPADASSAAHLTVTCAK